MSTCYASTCLCRNCGSEHSVRSKRPSMSHTHRTRQTSPSTISYYNSASSGRSVVESAPHLTLKQLGIPFSTVLNPRYRGRKYNISYVTKCVNGRPETVALLKWVRRKHKCDDDVAHEDHSENFVRAAKTAQSIVDAFQEAHELHGWRVGVTQPKVVAVDGNGAYHPKGHTVLYERYLPNFEKFNASSGWAVSSRHFHHRVIQALTHYSLVATKGEMMITNLQGTVNVRDKTILLSCPTILTKDGGSYGCTDIGVEGMRNVMRWHTCSSLCAHLGGAGKR